MNVRMATHNDVEALIKVRFDYFAAENWELTNDMRLSLKKSYRCKFNTNYL